jgi:hypothetical protein
MRGVAAHRNYPGLVLLGFGFATQALACGLVTYSDLGLYMSVLLACWTVAYWRACPTLLHRVLGPCVIRGRREHRWLVIILAGSFALYAISLTQIKSIDQKLEDLTAFPLNDYLTKVKDSCCVAHGPPV